MGLPSGDPAQHDRHPRTGGTRRWLGGDCPGGWGGAGHLVGVRGGVVGPVRHRVWVWVGGWVGGWRARVKAEEPQARLAGGADLQKRGDTGSVGRWPLGWWCGLPLRWSGSLFSVWPPFRQARSSRRRLAWAVFRAVRRHLDERARASPGQTEKRDAGRALCAHAPRAHIARARLRLGSGRPSGWWIARPPLWRLGTTPFRSGCGVGGSPGQAWACPLALPGLTRLALPCLTRLALPGSAWLRLVLPRLSQPGQALPDPALPDPTRPSPAQPDPAQPSPARPGPSRASPSRPAPTRPALARWPGSTPPGVALPQ
ncbi:hypothetical protein APASM_5308 [Actinosynnema pretiosum subsp. pretiosum]|nr:hypothetical protein APASM_5308 [Actinosynnema pretiosum subsp. pretiosum]